MAESSQRWLALESNPEVINKYIQCLGADPEWGFQDVLGFDPELLEMVPKPVAAVLLLFPYTDAVKSSPQGTEDASASLYFTKQTIGNACGTIGVIHALANNMDKIKMASDKHFQALYEATKDLSPEARAKYLEEDKELGDAHESSASEGQTKTPAREESVRHHFVTFIHKDGGLYEMDGRRGSPVRHGDTTPDTLLQNASAVIKKYIALEPDNPGFSAIALCKLDG
ncbi:ubiquitin carboxyl-terminal hydrolase-like isoform X2 [Lineus longissimus]|uniref:ubiquitin carboxyl-terminal hydrolase-like isoform X2 n=1 Tax=Lineus longissimus TaxID=88925 RepID=UPI00315D6D83